MVIHPLLLNQYRRAAPLNRQERYTGPIVFKQVLFRIRMISIGRIYGRFQVPGYFPKGHI